jgi:arylformamidase
MCEACPKLPTGWIGWNTLPAARPIRATGPWLDLTHKVGPDMPCASIFPRPHFARLRSLPDDPYNITELKLAAHAGTHIDAPLHYFADGPGMDNIALDRLCGTGVVWRIDCVAEQVIEIADLEACTPLLQPGDILAVDTGWAQHFGTALYDHHPSFSAKAAAWMVDQRIKLLACDFATPDLVYHLRQPGFDWPVHRLLLAHGILICEHLIGHAALAGQRVEFNFAALPLIDGDGAPARVMARRIEP